MFLDEAFYAGSKATKNQMKTKITEPYVVINEKHVPQYTIERFSSVVLASNEDHVINREVKSRRYLCLGLNNSYAGGSSRWLRKKRILWCNSASRPANPVQLYVQRQPRRVVR